MTRREISSKLNEIVEFSGVQKFIDTPVKRYSSGMYVRLAFSVAAHLEPEILLVDEVLAVGDAEFQRRCLGRMEELSQHGRTVLFVSHNMQVLARLCDRAILLKEGSVVMDGPSEEVVAQYLQTEAGSGSRRVWPDPATAPAGKRARLREVRVIGQDGDLLDAADVRRPVGIEISFTLLRDDVPVFPKIKVRDREGEHRLQRDGHVRFLGARRGRGLRLDRVDSRQLPERGSLRGRRGDLQPGHGRLPEARPPCGCPRGGLVPRSRSGRGRLLEGQTMPAIYAVPCGPSSSGPPRAGRANAMQIAAVVLLHNEDVYAERVIRNVAEFCDRVHVADHMSSDGTWGVVSELARELDHVDAVRISNSGLSHDLIAGYAGTDTWVFGPDGDELYDPDGLKRLRVGARGRPLRPVLPAGARR